VILVVTFS